MIAYILDTETTGQKQGQQQVIELAYAELKLHPVRFKSIRTQRFLPSCDILPEAMAVHGILITDLAGLLPSASAKIPQCDYIVGHSVDYDWEALAKPDVKRICTLALSRRYFPGGSHSLGAMMYRIMPPQLARELLRKQHEAYSDLACCALLLDSLVTAIGLSETADWEELWKISEEAREPLVWAFGKHNGQPIEDAGRGYWRWAVENLTEPDLYLIRKLKRLLGDLPLV